MNTQRLQQLLTIDEGAKLHVYRDSKGIWTIGVGHNLEAHGLPPALAVSIMQRVDLTSAECGQLFDLDLANAEAEVLRVFPAYAQLDEVRQAAVIDMAFNLGEGGLAAFKQTFLPLLASGYFNEAAADLRQQKVDRQLPVRYERLAKMIETGQWPAEVSS